MRKSAEKLLAVILSFMFFFSGMMAVISASAVDNPAVVESEAPSEEASSESSAPESSMPEGDEATGESSGSEVDSGAETDPDAETGTDTEASSGSGSETNPDSEAGSGTETNPDAEGGSSSEGSSGSEADQGESSETDPNTDQDTDSSEDLLTSLPQDTTEDILAILPQAQPVVMATCPIATNTSDPTPVLIFESPFSGTITYQGAWSSPTTEVVQGENLIEFTKMANGRYENCSFTITGAGGETVSYVSPPFTVKAASISNLWNHMRTSGFDYDEKALRNPTEAAWLANHHDMVVAGSVRKEVIYDALKGANPDVLLIGYISMQVEPEKWLENWAVEHGYDPEDLYYHYYYDTTVQLTQGRTLFIPGWGGGSATTRKEARASSMYGGYSPMCPISPVFVKAYSAYALHLLTVDESAGKYIDGIFIDGYAEVVTNRYTVQRTVEYIDLYGETSHEETRVNNGRDMTLMRNYMEMYTSAMTGQDIRVMGNASEADYPNGTMSTGFADHYDHCFNEISIEYLTKPIRTRQYDIPALKHLYDNMEDGVMIMANSETAWPDRFRSSSPDDDWTEETWFNYLQHIFATQYLIAHPNGYFAYHAGSASIYATHDGHFANSHWHVNYEYDIGKPVVRQEADYWGETGTDRFFTFEKGPYTPGNGYAYEILGREYEKALVIAKFGRDTAPQVGIDRITHQLNGNYRRLLADNSLGPVITEISLGQGEGAILIKTDESPSRPPSENMDDEDKTPSKPAPADPEQSTSSSGSSLSDAANNAASSGSGFVSDFGSTGSGSGAGTSSDSTGTDTGDSDSDSSGDSSGSGNGSDDTDSSGGLGTVSGGSDADGGNGTGNGSGRPSSSSGSSSWSRWAAPILLFLTLLLIILLILILISNRKLRQHIRDSN